MKKGLLTSALLLSLSWSSFSFANEKLTDKQKKELYEFGTVTVYAEDGVTKKGHFEVQIIPGTKHIKEHAVSHLKHAESMLKDFLEAKEFWHDEVLENFLRGYRYMKQNVVEEGVCTIPDAFRETKEENKKLTGFGTKAARVKNWLKFGAGCVGKVAQSVWGVGAGTIYSIVAPTGHIVFRPIAAATEALFAGAMWPAAKFAWNGTAWIAIKGDDAPSSDADNMYVTWVPEYFVTQPVAAADHDDL